jgi:hypothetical protein
MSALLRWNAPRRRAAGVLITAALGWLVQGPSWADDASARNILKAMSDYLASQKHLAAKFDVDLEIITPQVEKLQFSASGEIALSRPDKLRVSRTGGYTDVELVFDGKTATVLGKHIKAYTQIEAPGSVDALIDRLRGDHHIDMPGADLLLSNVYNELSAGVLEAKHIGAGVVDGIECEHLAFRNEETDWQLWVRAGRDPIPCKYVITSKTLAAAPQYTLRVRDWKTDAAPEASVFVFAPPAGAQAVGLDALADIGELPQPAGSEERKQ